MTSLLTTSAPPTPPNNRSPVLGTHPAREVATFVGLTTAMAVGIALALPHAGIGAVLSAMTPLLAVAMITFLRTPQGSRRALWGTFGIKRAGWGSWPIAFVIGAVLVFAIPYGVAVLLGSARFGLSSVSRLDVGINLAINLAVGVIFAMTEEIGWRSYMLPRVQMLVSRRRAALVVGFVHGLFHLPLMLLTDTYNNVGNRWIVAPTVVLTITAAGVFYAWLKDRSDSVWPVAFAHATANLFLDGAGLVVIVTPAALAYTASESGLVTLASIAGCAALLLTRGRTWTNPHSTTRRT
jgi:uncharacterized protein